MTKKKKSSLKNPKILILYVFHEANEIVEYFLKCGIIEAENISYLFIINNLESDYEKFILTSKNVQVLVRENKYADFGGWSDGLVHQDNINKYEYFIFLNSSCVGPFVHPNVSENWISIFLKGLHRDDIKLFGTTINTCEEDSGELAHVQSWAFCMRQKEVKLCLENKIFDPVNYTDMDTKHDLIYRHEIPMSRLIIKNGGNIGAMTKLYHKVDFRKPETNKFGWFDDIAIAGGYLGETTNPYEVMFVKANRDIYIPWIRVYMYR
jgi:hypothetical protein